MQREVSARNVWRFNPDDIDSYCVKGVECELLELFPKVKSCGLRLDLTYEDELVGDVNIESDADSRTVLRAFSKEEELKYKTNYVKDCLKPAVAMVNEQCKVSKNTPQPPKKKRKVSV